MPRHYVTEPVNGYPHPLSDALVPRLIEDDPATYGKLSTQGQGCGLAVFLFVVLAAVGAFCT